MGTKKLPEQPVSLVCVQQIGVVWTKASRGGEGAVARNKVPKALPFPSVTRAPQTPSLLLQVIDFSEGFPHTASEGFQNKRERDLQVMSVTEPYCFKGVSACFFDGYLNVEYEYKWEQGMPWRYSTTNEVARLESGQWCQVLFNGRYSSRRYAYGESNHWYESTFINIGLFHYIETEMFLKTKPEKVYDRMAHLF